ncbi:PAS domain-containing protein [bacterium]|nr:PAS domain-containing protein [bacterium]
MPLLTALRKQYRDLTTPFRSLLNRKGADQQEPPEGLLLQRHQVLVENLAAALVIRDRDGLIRYCSPFTEVLLGHPLRTLYDSPGDFFLEAVHPEDRDSLQRSLALAQLGESFQARHRYYHHSGFEMWIESRTDPLFDDAGEMLSSLTIMLDVTRAVRFEEQLKERTQDLQEITSIAAEEIQNEVFTLKGMLQFEGRGISREEANGAIHRSGNRLDELARGLTEFGKATRSKGELRKFSLREVLTEFREEQHSCGVTVLCEEIGEELLVIGDREELQEVLETLVRYSSSLLPTPEEGEEEHDQEEVPLILHLEVDQKSQTLPGGTSRGELTLLYRDSCPPLPLPLAERIFSSANNRSASSPYGSGSSSPFSLSLARKRMRQMGGALSFRITEKSENCFALRLRSETL